MKCNRCKRKLKCDTYRDREKSPEQFQVFLMCKSIDVIDEIKKKNYKIVSNSTKYRPIRLFNGESRLIAGTSFL